MQDEEWDEVVHQLDSRLYNAAERDMALEVLATMRRLGRDFETRNISLVAKAPKPQPQLRIAPRI